MFRNTDRDHPISQRLSLRRQYQAVYFVGVVRWCFSVQHDVRCGMDEESNTFEFSADFEPRKGSSRISRDQMWSSLV